jgi:predicted nucleic-acid-binding Zn-ribbon protein
MWWNVGGNNPTSHISEVEESYEIQFIRVGLIRPPHRRTLASEPAGSPLDSLQKAVQAITFCSKNAKAAISLYCWLEQTYPDVSSQVNFLNLPTGILSTERRDDERYVVLAQPLTGYTACPACGSTAFVKNGRDVQHLHDLPAQGKQVVIQVQRQRYLCRDCRAS